MSSKFKIPSLPKHIIDCLLMVEEPNVNIGDFIPLVQKDMGIATRVLFFANSAKYLQYKKTSDLKTALTRIGIFELSQIVVQHYLEEQFKFEPYKFFNKNYVFSRSILISQIAFELAKSIKLEKPYKNLLAGLFYDLGHLIRLSTHRNEFEKLIDHISKHKVNFQVAENDLGFKHHEELSVECLTQWEIDPEIIDLVKNQNFYHTNKMSPSLDYFHKCLACLAISENSTMKIIDSSLKFLAPNINQISLDILFIQKENLYTICKDCDTFLSEFEKEI